MSYEIINQDCIKAMQEMTDGCIDAIVTDPPYGLAFMGANWDHNVPSVSYWSECLRVAKSGAHLLCFGGTRTFHRLMCAIEDAGWEIRDTIMWVYGSGFPKSMDVAKAIDKQRRDDPRPVCRYLRDAIERSNETTATIAEKFGFNRRMVEHWAARDTDSQPAVPTIEQWVSLKDILGLDSSMDAEVERLNERKGEFGDDYKNAEILGTHKGDAPGLAGERFTHVDKMIRAPHSDAAKEWQGWGTCLKPAWEPIIVARKPLDGTVASNVLKWGVGAMNIDGCRVPTGDKLGGGVKAGSAQDGWRRPFMDDPDKQAAFAERKKANVAKSEQLGRFPASLVHDGSQEVLELFPDTNPSRKGRPRSGRNGMGWGMTHTGAEYDDAGSAARFFYCAKASKKDRGEGNDHPTVKPNALMRWLVRLVCPQGGTVLDPFMGSGSTGVACIQEGMRFVGIDMDEHYCEIAEKRIGAEPDTVFAENFSVIG